MRLAPYGPDETHNPVAGDATLDEILALNADRDPNGRALFAPELPFEGTWREVDRAVSALARTFRGWELGDDATVGVQLGSSAHGAVTCLALWRAGLVPAMLPLAWRRRETLSALSSVGATAIVAPVRAGGADIAQIGCEIAVGLETIRYIGCFGEGAPDGATPLDEALDAPATRVEKPERPEDAPDHVAIVTFDAGGAPVARSHNELVAAGLGPILAARLSGQSALLSTLDLAGFLGLATGLAPWLTSGCSVAFHQASGTEALGETVRGLGATHLVVPGRAAGSLLADCGFAPETFVCVTAAWRAPDGRGPAEDLTAAARIVDAFAFGELGVYAAARAERAWHVTIPLGPGGAEGIAPLIELKVTPEGRLALRGAACPQAPCPADPAAPSLVFDADGFVETGIAAVADRAARRISLGGKRRGVAQVGGLAVALSDVEAAYRRAGVRGRAAPQDDPLFGARLAIAGDAADDPIAAADALTAAGFGPAMTPVSPREEAARRRA